MSGDDFVPLELKHKEIFKRFFQEDPPEISEFTFTNLFIWRHHYHPRWKEQEGCLLLMVNHEGQPPFGFQPVGLGDKKKALAVLCDYLKGMTQEVKIGRVSESFLQNHADPDRYTWVFDRDNSDYVYQAKDLIQLSGNRYHRKKNHVNRFVKSYAFRYRSLDLELVECVLEMQESWCQMRECVGNQELLSEDYAVHEALIHFEELGYEGAAIEIDGKLEAFSLGEALNPNTAVVHIEKANPQIPGLYAAINQLFCQNAWSRMDYVNREQDLGKENLRTAKESYYPHHLVKKYTITPR